MDFFGCVIPLIIEVIILVFFIIKRDNFPFLYRYIFLVLVLTSIIAYSTSVADYLFAPSKQIGVESPAINVISFILAPLLAWILIYFIADRYLKKTIFKSRKMEYYNNKELIMFILLLFSVIGLTAMGFDLTIASSQYNIVHFGGAMVIDGLIWAPVLSISVFTVFLVLRRLLRLTI